MSRKANYLVYIILFLFVIFLAAFIAVSLFNNFDNFNLKEESPERKVTNSKAEDIIINRVYPIRQFFYEGGNSIVYFELENANQNPAEIEITHEWFDDGKLITSAKQNLTFEKKFRSYAYSQLYGAEKINYVLTVNYSGKTKKAEANYTIIKNSEASEQLQNSELVNWTDEIADWAFNNVHIENYKTEKEQAEALFNLVKLYLDYENKISGNDLTYDDIEADSVNVFKNGKGTSSEFAVLFASLSRIMGIPAKIGFNRLNKNGKANPVADFIDVYYAEIYIDGKWKVFDVNKGKFVECFDYYSSFAYNIMTRYICYKGAYSAEFRQLYADESKDRAFIRGELKNIGTADFDTGNYALKAEFYEKNGKFQFSQSYPLGQRVIPAGEARNFSAIYEGKENTKDDHFFLEIVRTK